MWHVIQYDPIFNMIYVVCMTRLLSVDLFRLFFFKLTNYPLYLTNCSLYVTNFPLYQTIVFIDDTNQ